MDTEEHPFHAVAKLADLRGLEELRLVVERDGRYVRLVQRKPDLLFMREGDKLDSIDRQGFSMHPLIALPPSAFENGPTGTLQALLDEVAKHVETTSDYKHPLFKHPIGADHPFPAVHALAQEQNLHMLKIVNVYNGTLIRLYTNSPDICFKLKGDPGSAMDRQRFDYSKHIRIDRAAPEEMLKAIKSHIVEHGLK